MKRPAPIRICVGDRIEFPEARISGIAAEIHEEPTGVIAVVVEKEDGERVRVPLRLDEFERIRLN